MKARRYSRPGTLADLRRVLWIMIRRVEELSDDDAPPEQILKCAHALSQLAGSYRSVTKTASLEERLRALERAAEGNGHAEH